MFIQYKNAIDSTSLLNTANIVNLSVEKCFNNDDFRDCPIVIDIAEVARYSIVIVLMDDILRIGLWKTKKEAEEFMEKLTSAIENDVKIFSLPDDVKLDRGKFTIAYSSAEF